MSTVFLPVQVGPAPEYTFTLLCAAVGSYFKGGFVKPVSLLVDYSFHRAAPGGTGWVKAAGNYSQVGWVTAAFGPCGATHLVSWCPFAWVKLSL